MVTSFWDPSGRTVKDTPYGVRVHTNTFALLHDHLAAWKVDLDISEGGAEDAVLTDEIRVGTYAEAMEAAGIPGQPAPGWAPVDELRYLDRSFPPDEFRVVLNISRPKVTRIVSDKDRNRWGEPPGYAIVHDATTVQLLRKSPLLRPAAWSKQHVAFTRRKARAFPQTN